MTAGVGRVATKMDTCVLFVVLLLSWVNLSYLAQYVYPRWVTLDDPFVVTFAVYGISMSLACWCYVKTVQTHPGRVPLAWRETPTPFGSDESSPMFEDRRYCAICCHFKPPRTHHCSTCRQCILKYDHHCPWVGNCIGYYNHRYFLLLVTYLPVAAWVVVVSEYRTLILCAPALTRGPLPTVPVAPSQPLWAEAACPPSGFAFVNFVLCYGITVLSAVVLAMFALQHWWLLLLNKTTVEKMQVGQIHNPYDLGYCGNILSVCSTSVWRWPFPVHVEEVSLNGGTRFPRDDGDRWKEADLDTPTLPEFHRAHDLDTTALPAPVPPLLSPS